MSSFVSVASFLSTQQTGAEGVRQEAGALAVALPAECQRLSLACVASDGVYLLVYEWAGVGGVGGACVRFDLNRISALVLMGRGRFFCLSE